MILQTVLHTTQHYKLISSGDLIIIAVSGGADSLALAHILLTLQSQLGLRLHIATFDHGLRGDASSADVDFVEQQANQWGVPVTVGRADTSIYSQGNQEAIARRARYDFLAQVATEHSASAIATAHHMGDQLETILMHLVRGSGLNGLQGMAFASSVPHHRQLRLIRPLLNVTRDEIEAYIEANQLAPRHDLTNDDRSYFRNALRHDVVPTLRRFNPQVEQAAARVATALQTDTDFISQQTDTAFDRVVQTIEPERVTVSAAMFGALHPAIQSRVLMRAVRQIMRDVELTQVVVQAALALANAGHTGQIAELGAGLQLRVEYEQLIVERAGSYPQMIPYAQLDMEQTLCSGGVIRLDDRHSLEVITHYRPDATARLAMDSTHCITVRTRRAGDRWQPLGLGGRHQKLKDTLINRKVPAHWRDKLPLLEVDGQIAAIILPDGWLISEVFAVRDDSQAVTSFILKT